MRKTKDPRVGRRGSAIAGIVLGIIGGVVSVPVLQFYLMMSHTGDRVRTGTNLTEIGQAIIDYQINNRGRNPPDLGTLVKTQNISVSVFLAPSMPGGSSLPSNLDEMTIDQKASWVNQHTDFVYWGAGLIGGGPAETIVVYEKRDEWNSPPDGSYDDYELQMLFADGSVLQIPSAEAHRRIESQKSNGSPDARK